MRTHIPWFQKAGFLAFLAFPEMALSKLKTCRFAETLDFRSRILIIFCNGVGNIRCKILFRIILRCYQFVYLLQMNIDDIATRIQIWYFLTFRSWMWPSSEFDSETLKKYEMWTLVPLLLCNTLSCVIILRRTHIPTRQQLGRVVWLVTVPKRGGTDRRAKCELRRRCAIEIWLADGPDYRDNELHPVSSTLTIPKWNVEKQVLLLHPRPCLTLHNNVR